MPDFFPTTDAELDTALAAAVSGETISVQQPVGNPITDVVTLTPTANWTIAAGVTLTSNGTRDTRRIDKGSGWAEGTPTPANLTITDLTIGDGAIVLFGAVNFAMTDCIIDGNLGGGGRIDSNAFTAKFSDDTDRWSQVVTITRCEARGFQRDGWSTSKMVTGSPADGSNGHLILDQIFQGELSDMGLDANDQVATSHDLCKLTVKNSRIGVDSSYPTVKAISSGAPKSPITVENTTIVRGSMDASNVSNVVLLDALNQVCEAYAEPDPDVAAGSLTGTWSDVLIVDNIQKISFTATTTGDTIELNRCRFFFQEHEAANHSATTTQVNGLWAANADVTFRSCLLVGSPRTSSGYSSPIRHTGAADSSRAARFFNCTFAHWGIGMEGTASYWQAGGIELNNCLMLDLCVEAGALGKLFQAFDAASVTGKNNFFDQDPQERSGGGGAQAASWGTELNVGLSARTHGTDTSLIDPLNLHDANGHILPDDGAGGFHANGDGANAYSMGNFAGYDYRPVLPETYKGAGKIFDWGDNTEMEATDALGFPFTDDTVGCFAYQTMNKSSRMRIG